jgi:hypothetical protein
VSSALNLENSMQHDQTATAWFVPAGGARMRQRRWATAARDDTWTVLR